MAPFYWSYISLYSEVREFRWENSVEIDRFPFWIDRGPNIVMFNWSRHPTQSLGEDPEPNSG